MLKITPITKLILKELQQDQRINGFVKFLRQNVSDMIDNMDSKNREALKIVNNEFADIVEANPGLLKESTNIMEMSRVESANIFDLYAQFAEQEIKPNMSSIPDRESAEKLIDIVIELAQNIKSYPTILAGIALELSDIQFYKETIG